MAKADLSTFLLMSAAALAACTGAVSATGVDGGDDAGTSDASGDISPSPDAHTDSGDAGTADNAAYCAMYLDSANQYYACSAAKCCDPFAVCMHSPECQNVGACGIACLAEAGDVGDKTAYCDDVCADVDTVGQHQRAAWSDCYDLSCRD